MAAPTTLPLPRYMTGKQATLFSVQGGAIGSNGNFTWTTATDMLVVGVFREMIFRAHYNDQDIHPSNWTVENYVDIVAGWQVTLRGLRTDNGYALLNDLVASGNSHLRILCQNTSLTGSAGYIFAAVGKRRETGFNQGEGEHNEDLVIVPCGLPCYFGIPGSNPI